ncbi:MAG: hypothetical protein K1X56_13595 [Flavobacteriales bacterium]|nr:hypothetical protein [Flavobacteriales bacterium]
MKKYSIHKEEKGKAMSDEEILGYKDFSRLHHRYEEVTKRPKQPLYKNPYLFFVLVLIILLALMLAGEL